METVVLRTVFDLIAQGSIAATPHRKQGFADRAIGATCTSRSKESCRPRPVHRARQKGRGGAPPPSAGNDRPPRDESDATCYIVSMASRLKRSESPDADLWPILEAAARYDDGAAARSHLDAGRPIYYGEKDTPPGLVVKEYPDGRRELVRFDHMGEHRVRDAA